MIHFICKSCGNRDSFSSEITKKVEIEGNYLSCDECNSYNLKEFDSIETLEEFIYEHTTKSGKWSEIYLKEKDRNKKLRMKRVINCL